MSFSSKSQLVSGGNASAQSIPQLNSNQQNAVPSQSLNPLVGQNSTLLGQQAVGLNPALGLQQAAANVHLLTSQLNEVPLLPQLNLANMTPQQQQQTLQHMQMIIQQQQFRELQNQQKQMFQQQQQQQIIQQQQQQLQQHQQQQNMQSPVLPSQISQAVHNSVEPLALTRPTNDTSSNKQANGNISIPAAIQAQLPSQTTLMLTSSSTVSTNTTQHKSLPRPNVTLTKTTTSNIQVGSETSSQATNNVQEQPLAPQTTPPKPVPSTPKVNPPAPKNSLQTQQQNSTTSTKTSTNLARGSNSTTPVVTTAQVVTSAITPSKPETTLSASITTSNMVKTTTVSTTVKSPMKLATITAPRQKQQNSRKSSVVSTKSPASATPTSSTPAPAPTVTPSVSAATINITSKSEKEPPSAPAAPVSSVVSNNPKTPKQAPTAHSVSSTPSGPATPDETPRGKRKRIRTTPYQSPIPELALISKLTANETSSPKNNEDKLIIFYKNEFLAVRNAEGSFFLCQTLHNVFKSSPRIRIRWLSEKGKDEIFKLDFYDVTDIDCVLTNVALKRIERELYSLPKNELERIQNILKKAIDVEKGILPRPNVTEENPDGLDLSLYKDESQLEKKTPQKRKAPATPPTRTNAIRSAKKPKRSAKKKIISPKVIKTAKIVYDDVEDDYDEEDDDGDDDYVQSNKSISPKKASSTVSTKNKSPSKVVVTSGKGLVKKPAPQVIPPAPIVIRSNRTVRRSLVEEVIEDVPIKKANTNSIKNSKTNEKKPLNNKPITSAKAKNKEPVDPLALTESPPPLPKSKLSSSKSSPKTPVSLAKSPKSGNSSATLSRATRSGRK